MSLVKTLLANSSGSITLNETDQHGFYQLLEELEEAITPAPEEQEPLQEVE